MRTAGRRRDNSGPRNSIAHLLVLAAVVCGNAATAFGQGVNREYQLKAVYLYRFATYIQWPDRSFPAHDSPFVIGILGPDPVGVHLRKIAAVKTIDGRPIEIRHYRQLAEVDRCHILFITRAVDANTQQAALRHLAMRNILLVGETPAFLQQGGVFNFAIGGNRILIFISKSAYERAGLKVSSQLTRIATVVE